MNKFWSQERVLVVTSTSSCTEFFFDMYSFLFRNNKRPVLRNIGPPRLTTVVRSCSVSGEQEIS